MASNRFFIPVMASLVTGLSWCGVARSQPVPPSRKTDEAPVTVSGVVSQYLLTPEGDIDGLLLKDGKQLHFPPHLGRAILAAIKPEDRVVASAVLKAGEFFEVQQLSAKKRVIEFERRPGGAPPPPPPPPPGPAPVRRLQTLQAQGRVKAWLYGPLGDVNGFLLSNGASIKLPPETALNLSSLITPGTLISVEGNGSSSPNGICIRATAIGIGNQPRIPIYAKFIAPPEPAAPPPPPLK